MNGLTTNHVVQLTAPLHCSSPLSLRRGANCHNQADGQIFHITTMSPHRMFLPWRCRSSPVFPMPCFWVRFQSIFCSLKHTLLATNLSTDFLIQGVKFVMSLAGLKLPKENVALVLCAGMLLSKCKSSHISPKNAIPSCWIRIPDSWWLLSELRAS